MNRSKIILWGVGLLALVLSVGAIAVQGKSSKLAKARIDLVTAKEEWTKAHNALIMDEGIKLRGWIESRENAKRLSEERDRLERARNPGAVALGQMDVEKSQKKIDECNAQSNEAIRRMDSRYADEREKWMRLRILAEQCGDPLTEELALKAAPKPKWLVELENAAR